MRSSKRSRSPNAFFRPLASTTTLPRRGPGGDVDLGRVVAGLLLPRRGASRRRRCGPCSWPGGARGFIRTHSSSRERVFWRAPSCFCSLLEALLLLLQPAGVVALVGVARAAVELEDPPGDVVEEVAVVGDGHDGARVLVEEALEPGDALGVEVVGGLVEEQDVRLARGAGGRARRGASRRRRAAATSASAGGRRRASMARSTTRSISQPPAASILSCDGERLRSGAGDGAARA